MSPLVTDLIVLFPESTLKRLLVPGKLIEEGVFICFDFLFKILWLVFENVKPFRCGFLSGCIVTTLLLGDLLRECVGRVAIDEGSAGLALSLLNEDGRKDAVVQVTRTSAR